jgi:hypothetical protein
MSAPLSFRNIRDWRGSQDQAFEELCYQLRDATPRGAELVKTGSPDAGLEWYFKFANGVEWGWQAKYSFEIDKLLKLMEESLKTVITKRKNCRRLTFCIPFDLPDARQGRERKSAREKFEDRKKSWAKRLPGADRVRIELVSEGDLLERLSRDPAQRGKTWFFWHQEVFSPEWCEKRLAITVEAAGERYSPELHVELPVAFALEGLATSEEFWARYRQRRGVVRKTAERIAPRRFSGLGRTAELREVRRALDAWKGAVAESIELPARLPRDQYLALTGTCLDSLGRAYPEERRRREKLSDKEAKLDERRRALRYELGRVAGALRRFASFLDSPAACAAERGALLMTGDAGQGKTHLLCDTGAKAAAAGRPAAVLLAGAFSGRRVWADVAEQLGLSSVGSEVLLDGMRAAAQASDAPFLLLIDALNEAADPSAWQQVLPSLIAEVRHDPWVALGLSVRSTFNPVVLPPGGLGDGVARADHPGFRGREVEATERFFDAFGLEQPRIPLLTPEFTNPLFLKLYCEGLKGLGLSGAPSGETHVSDVFDRYLRWKAERIVAKLRVDPTARPVQQAIEAFSAALLDANRDTLPYEEARQVADQFAPGRVQWPDTMFGQLLSEGVLSSDVAYDLDTGEHVQVARFSYQRFADHHVAVALIAPFESSNALHAALAAGQPLRKRLLAAPAGWIEALSVAIPERLGVELLDAARWHLRSFDREIWERALVHSIVSRRPEAVTKRTRELMWRAERRSQYLADEVLDALLTVGPIPDHPLNAAYLHRALISRSLPERDLIWSARTYFAFDGEGPIDRLIRWAARGAYPDCSDAVLELAGTVLAWTFTSPNRILRDYATKATAQLFAGRPDALQSLLERFRGVNDPYVMERLAVSAHGSMLLSGRASSALADVARKLKDVALAPDQLPNIITRDAVRGAHELCHRHGVIELTEYTDVLPPYGASPPEKPRTKKQLERAYERDRWRRQAEPSVPSPYLQLFGSIFDLGDFGRYVIETETSSFTRHPLGEPIRKPRRRRRPIDSEGLAAFLARLKPEQQAAFVEDPRSLVETLSFEQTMDLRSILEPPVRPDPREQYPAELAQRWVFERVLSLGWSPDRFNDFDDTHGRQSADRSEHKPETFRKKYQWLALRELVARIADNFHMKEEWGEGTRRYQGPWQFYGRDIDPTLPPALRLRDDEGDPVLGPTYLPDAPERWWLPPGPTYARTDPYPTAIWVRDDDDIPPFEPLVRKRDPDDDEWVVLQAYYNWDDEVREDEEFGSRRRRDMWSHIYGWLVRPEGAQHLVDYLGRHTLMGRWMPLGGDVTDAAYLAEMPWAEAAREYPHEWQELRPRGPDAEDIDLRVLPAWIGYAWEGNILDCSINDGVSTRMPAPLLFETTPLEWQPNTREWSTTEGVTVAQHRSAEGHSVLLVRESWLRTALDQTGCALVVGWLGEKSLFERGWDRGRVGGGWTEINGTASFDGSTWHFGPRRIDFRTHA